MDDIDLLLKQSKEISVELDIKKEMRNRVTLGELTIIKRRPWRNIIKIVDDPLSEWKKPQFKYRRQALDFTMLGWLSYTDLTDNIVDDDNDIKLTILYYRSCRGDRTEEREG